MLIVSIRDKRVKALVEDPNAGSVKGFSAEEVRKVSAMVAAIQVMTHPLQLRAVDAWKAHELVPGHPGKWSLKVTPNYRLTFYVDLKEQEVSILDYEDYH